MRLQIGSGFAAGSVFAGNIFTENYVFGTTVFYDIRFGYYPITGRQKRNEKQNRVQYSMRLLWNTTIRRRLF